MCRILDSIPQATAARDQQVMQQITPERSEKAHYSSVTFILSHENKSFTRDVVTVALWSWRRADYLLIVSSSPYPPVTWCGLGCRSRIDGRIHQTHFYFDWKHI